MIGSTLLCSREGIPMRRSKIGKYGREMTPAEMKKSRVMTILSFMSIWSSLLVVGLLAYNLIFAEKPLFSNLGSGSEVEEASLSIQQSVNSYIKNNKELKGDERVTVADDDEWAKYQERMRHETRSSGVPKSYYDIKVGETKIGELETERSTTINVRGTVDHYTIEIFDAYSGKYNGFDNRHIYDSAKDKK